MKIANQFTVSAPIEEAWDVLCDLEPARRAQVLDRLERRLVDDGCLFLGVDERPDGDSIAFRPVAGRKGLYVKAPSALRRAA